MTKQRTEREIFISRLKLFLEENGFELDGGKKQIAINKEIYTLYFTVGFTYVAFTLFTEENIKIRFEILDCYMYNCDYAMEAAKSVVNKIDIIANLLWQKRPSKGFWNLSSTNGITFKSNDGFDFNFSDI